MMCTTTTRRCCSSKTQLVKMQKELKYWKERSFIQKKMKTSLANWITGVFGFVVKVECDKLTSIIRIEGREYKEALNNAAVSCTCRAGEDKVLLMEDKITSEDFLEEAEEIDGLAIALEEFDTSEDNEEDNSLLKANDNNIPDNQSPSTTSGSHLQQQQQSLEIATSEDNSSTEVVYIGNYEDGSLGGGHSSYFILKSGENEDIPVQFDYSSFINGDINSPGENQQIFYRIGTSPDSTNNEISNTSSVSSISTVSKSSSPSLTKKKLPVTKNIKAKKDISPTIPFKIPKYSTETDSSSTSVLAIVNKSKKIVPPKPKKDISTNSTKFPEERVTSPAKSPLEFGLTLREKAEIYVRTKAKAAIKKSGSGYSCTLCPNNYSYSSIENAITHTKSHFEQKPYKCELCEEIFGIQRELLFHRKTVHPKMKVTTTVVDLKSPTKQPSSTPVSYVASIPILPTITSPVKSTTPNTGKSIAVQPKDNNSTKKPFKCQLTGCDWSYISAEELGWHMKAHSQARV